MLAPVREGHSRSNYLQVPISVISKQAASSIACSLSTESDGEQPSRPACQRDADALASGKSVIQKAAHFFPVGRLVGLDAPSDLAEVSKRGGKGGEAGRVSVVDTPTGASLPTGVPRDVLS